MRGDGRMVVLTLLLFACGQNPNPNPNPNAQADAATDNGAALDGQTTDAAVPGLVTITVRDWTAAAAPMPDQAVAFQNADGTVVSVTTTDAQGTASATMLPGGSVTTVRAPRAGYAGDWVYTFVGVKPGDHLVVGAPADPAPPATFTASILLPTFSTAYDYQVTTRCGDGYAQPAVTPTAQMTLSCSPVDVYVRATDTSYNHFTAAAFYKKNVTVAPNATIDLTQESFLPITQVPITVTHLPTYVTFGYAELFLCDGAFCLEGGTPYGATIGNSEAHASVPLPPIAGVDLVAITKLEHRTTSGPSPEMVQDLRERVPFTGSYTADASTRLTSWVPYNAGVDPISQRLFWPEDAGGTDADFVRAEVIVTYTVGTSSFGRFVREIAGRHDIGQLVLPPLPAPLDQYNFTPDRTNGSSFFYIARVPGGWDAVRDDIFQSFPWVTQAGQSTVASAGTNTIVYGP